VITHADLPEELNLATWFVDRNAKDRTALIDSDGATTYGELAGLVNRYGNVLRELGVKAQDRVLLVLADSVDFVAVWYGAQKIGAVTAEAYTFLQPKDYAYYLEYTDAKVVVADETTEAAIREVAGERTVLVVDGAPIEDASDELEPARTTKDDIALWKFTTGSTGQPKGAVHPVHSPVLSNDWYAQGVLGIREDDVVLPVPKLFFGYARDLAALYPFGVGGAGIVFPERSTPERIFELIAEHRPTILVNVPTMMAQMIDSVSHGRCQAPDMSSLRMCTSAGEALPRELHDRWLDTFGVEVLDGIGSSELYHIYVSNRPGRARPGSTGELVLGYEAEVGENGELLVTGETAALYYEGDEEKTKRTFDGDTVHTGDLFEQDDDGFFWYRGRVDDLIKVGGIWVAPAEIEHCLVGHPDVVECAVVGAAQNGLTVPRAYVVVRQPVEEQALQDFVRARLSPHKYPREVVFVDDLPKTPSGKLDRKALAA
jgi:benzoate-CoA ligase family protein